MDETYGKVQGQWKYLYRAVDEINNDREMPIEVRQIKYLNNTVEQDHRAVMRITKPMMGFKSFLSASNVLAG